MTRIYGALVMLALIAPLGPVPAAPAPHNCQLLPVPGSAVSYRAEVVPWLWFASWQATVSCPGTPLHGKTAQVDQKLGQPDRNNAIIRAPTQINIVIDVDFGPARFDGHVQGRVQHAGNAITSELQIQAQGPRGAVLQGGEQITLQTDTGEILLMPRGLAVRLDR